MPRYRFSLAIRVRCEIDMISGFCFLSDLLDDVASAAKSDVLRFKIVLHVDAERALRQIAHVAVGSNDFVFRAEILLDRLSLRGRLNDDQILCHISSLNDR